MRRFDSAQAYHIGFDPMNRHSVLWGFLLFYVFQGKGDDTMVSFSLKVRFYETDLMGVVHHANYLRWFEMGRVEYLRQDDGGRVHGSYCRCELPLSSVGPF